MKPNLLIINGSRHATKGQSGLISRHLKNNYKNDFKFEELVLMQQKNKKIWHKKLSNADAFIFISGTYWDSWGAPLQYFFEETTAWEATDVWLGKPVAVIVSEHSTGGKHVLSTMQGVLNTLGLMIIPLGGVVISKNNTLLARQLTKTKMARELEDFWGPADIAPLMQNLKQTSTLTSRLKIKWQSWRCDRKDFSKTWLIQKDL
jgi:NAD(P)H-dependent FMN reductase